MRIPEGEPFEVPEDHTGQEKSYHDVMGRNNAFSPNHLFEHHNSNESKALPMPRETLPEGVAPTTYSSDSRISVSPNYDVYDPYKPGNRERVIQSYGTGIHPESTKHETNRDISEPTEVYSAD